MKGCVWDNEMKSINWRIDVCTKSRHLEQLNQPSAVVEMKLEVNNLVHVNIVLPLMQEGDCVRFELTQQKLGELIEQVETIEQVITLKAQS